MDTQVAGDPDTDDEWAVDQILSHAGAGSDAIFKIKWKSGDITWLPHYQKTHLNTLTKHLDLLGVSKISRLPHRKGLPPMDDPQIFIGSISPLLTNSTPLPFHSIKTCFVSFLWTTTSLLRHTLRLTTQLSITVDIKLSSIMMCHWGINHPNFIHLSLTHYQVFSPNYELPATIHVEHLVDLLGFDTAIRDQGGLAGLTTLPLSFTKFASAWNTGVQADNPQHISNVFLAAKHQDSVAAATSHPVHLAEFHITLEQCGLAPTPNMDPATSSVQANINLKFALMFACQHQAQCHGFEGHKEKWLCAFTAGPATCTKAQRVTFKQKTKTITVPTHTKGPTSTNPATSTPKTGPLTEMETE